MYPDSWGGVPASREISCFRVAALGLLLATFAALTALPARAAGPAALSAERGAPSVRSTAGSGVFGSWFVDGFGLPAYRYRLDPDRDPRVRQPGLTNPTDAWHQLGNDHVVAIAHTRGYVQLWSQDRSYQWVNQLDPAAHQYAGGYGYLRTAGGRVISTLYSDRAAGARTQRDFAAGYFGRLTAARGVAVEGARVRAVRRRPGAAPRRHDSQHLASAAARQLGRVLGGEPEERRQRALHRPRAGVVPARAAHAVRRPAAGQRRPQAADRVRRGAARPRGRLGDRRHALLRPREPRPAGRGHRGPPVAHARRAASRRHGRQPPVRVPRARVGAARAGRSRCATPTGWRTRGALRAW